MAIPISKFVRNPFSGLSHLLGTALSVAGLVVLLLAARGRPVHLVSYAVYGASLITLYLASALYHTLQVGPRVVAWLNTLDYVGIFLLIAGTYTPVCLITLHGAWGWSILGTIWGLAVFGIMATVLWRGCPPWMRVVLYILMGWTAIVALGPLRAALPAGGLAWLLYGGAAYTVGVLFYATNWPRRWPGRFEGHDLWHLFVMAGSACHFVTVFYFIAR